MYVGSVCNGKGNGQKGSFAHVWAISQQLKTNKLCLFNTEKHSVTAGSMEVKKPYSLVPVTGSLSII